MSERPFMQLYVSDYFGDTRHLSCEQHGAYLLLLMTMWNAGGELADDDVRLARITCLSVKKWKAMRAVIMPFFEVGDGVISHNRMTKELQKSERQTDLRAAAGAKGGAATALKLHTSGAASATAKPVAGPQHLPEPYRKTREKASPPTEGAVWLDRWSDEALFKACETLRGKKTAEFMQKDVFNAATVAKARALLGVGSPEADSEAA